MTTFVLKELLAREKSYLRNVGRTYSTGESKKVLAFASRKVGGLQLALRTD
jgi:hypothetical protein